MKKFKEYIKESTNMSYEEALGQFILGQKVTNTHTVYPYGEFYGEGFVFENGYKWISYGAGCQGDDCNTSFIIDPDDNLIANLSW